MTSDCLSVPRTAADQLDGQPVFITLLHAGIPLSLLLDLMPADGPDSEELYALEAH